MLLLVDCRPKLFSKKTNLVQADLFMRVEFLLKAVAGNTWNSVFGNPLLPLHLLFLPRGIMPDSCLFFPGTAPND